MSKAIVPIHETVTIFDYLKACHHIRSESKDVNAS